MNSRPITAGMANVLLLYLRQAYVCADSQLLLDERDPFAWGIR